MKEKASTHERKIVNEMSEDVRKYYNKENNFWTNRQVFGMREVSKGFFIESWVALSLESIKF